MSSPDIVTCSCEISDVRPTRLFIYALLVCEPSILAFVLALKDEYSQVLRPHLSYGLQSLRPRLSLTDSLEADNPLFDALDATPHRKWASVAMELPLSNGRDQD